MPVVSSKEQVISPLRSEAWAEGLKSYPDLRLTRYILEGIEHRFRIRAMAGAVFRPSVRNLRSAHEQRHVVQKYLDREESLGRMLRLPHQSHSHNDLQISPFGVIPKKHKPNAWRLIVDLSAEVSMMLSPESFVLSRMPPWMMWSHSSGC